MLLATHLIITPRERIITICRDLANAVESADLSAIGRHLAADFEAADLDRSEFLERVERTLTRFDVIEPHLRKLDVVFPGDGVWHWSATGATVTFNVLCRIDSTEGYVDRLPSRWRLTLRKRRDRWEATKVETLPVPPLYARDVRELLERR